MAEHRIDYKTNKTIKLTQGEYFQIHRDTCDLCKGSGVNLLRARFNIDPITYLKTGKLCGCGHWFTFCHNCWQNILEIEKLIIEKLHKNTWPYAKDMFGPEEDRKKFVREYIRRYPMKKFISPEEWKVIKEELFGKGAI